MNESAPSFERAPIIDEQVIEALRGIETDPEAENIFKQWEDGLRRELDLIYQNEGGERFTIASVEYTIRRAAVYYRAGHAQKAIEDLSETVDLAGSEFFSKSGLYEKACELLEKMENGEVL
jgi:hypothetical protein